MKRYSNPQEIWDSWIKTRDSLLKRWEALPDRGEDTSDLGKSLRMYWEKVKEDLELAAIIKYLGIDASEQDRK